MGRRIAEIRRDQGLTQQKFAAAANKSVQWISRVELGEENLTLHTMVSIANVLDVEVAELFLMPVTEAGEIRRGRPRKGG